MMSYIRNLSGNSSSQSAVSTSGNDTASIGESTPTKYLLYTSSGEYADNPVARKTQEEIDVFFPQYAGMTGDEKWKAIVTKYTKDGLTLEKFNTMMCDLANNQLIDITLAREVKASASIKVGLECIDYDMQNGIVGDDDISSVFNKVLSVDDFFSGLTQFEKDFYKYDEDSLNFRTQQELYSTIKKLSKKSICS